MTAYCLNTHIYCCSILSGHEPVWVIHMQLSLSFLCNQSAHNHLSVGLYNFFMKIRTIKIVNIHHCWSYSSVCLSCKYNIIYFIYKNGLR